MFLEKHINYLLEWTGKIPILALLTFLTIAIYTIAMLVISLIALCLYLLFITIPLGLYKIFMRVFLGFWWCSICNNRYSFKHEKYKVKGEIDDTYYYIVVRKEYSACKDCYCKYDGKHPEYYYSI